MEAQSALQRAAERKIGAEKACDGAAILASVLGHLALEDRNSSAARALSAYSQLGEAEAARDLLEQTLAEVTRALVRVREVKAKGLESPVDEHALHRQQLDLEAKEVRLRVQVEQLNSELRQRLGLAPCPDGWRAWPADAFCVLAGPVDPEAAVASAQAHKPELQLLALLDAHARAGDFDALFRQLSGLSSLLGQSSAHPLCAQLQQLLASLCDKPDMDAVREGRVRQLALVRAERERKAIEEVRQAAQTARAQAEVLVLTEKVAEDWRARVRDAEDREAKGLGSFAETMKARVEWLRARGDVVKEAALLQRALVRLRELQGTLPGDCAARH
jgi:outer membrane protein TolC